MVQKWKGDDSFLLPALQVEPYRLWFEFLKLATTDKSLKVAHAKYQAWGDYQSMDFKRWWRLNWRTLFATGIGVHELSDGAKAKSDNTRLILSIPVNQAPARTLTQIREILKEKAIGTALKSMRQGKFELSVGFKNGRPIHPSTRFLRNLSKVRLLMHLYRFWLQFPDHDERRRLEETSKAYFKWANAWNTNVRTKKWNRPLIEIPFALTEYVKFLERRGERRRMSLLDENVTDIPNHRRQLARYIRKAHRIAENVAKGQFPGHYETASSK